MRRPCAPGPQEKNFKKLLTFGIKCAIIKTPKERVVKMEICAVIVIVISILWALFWEFFM